jgi:hypothetical protein
MASRCYGERRVGFGQDPLTPARHFERSAPGERQQQQALRIVAVQDQMSNPVSERLGLAGTGAGGDQQCRRRLGIAADAEFDGSALFRVEAVQMPPAIDRLQLLFLFCSPTTAIASARQGRNAPGLGPENAAFAVVQSAPPAGFLRPARESSLPVEGFVRRARFSRWPLAPNSPSSARLGWPRSPAEQPAFP